MANRGNSQDDICSLLSKRVYDIAGSTLVALTQNEGKHRRNSVDGVRDIFPRKIGVKIRLQESKQSKQDTEDGNTSKIHRIELQTSPMYGKEKCAVHLNGEKLDIKNFRDYCDLYLSARHGLEMFGEIWIFFLSPIIQYH